MEGHLAELVEAPEPHLQPILPKGGEEKHSEGGHQLSSLSQGAGLNRHRRGLLGLPLVDTNPSLLATTTIENHVLENFN